MPDVGLEAQGDVGQRNSPGEERALGLSGRGNLVAISTWEVVDSRRSSVRRQAAWAVEDKSPGRPGH